MRSFAREFCLFALFGSFLGPQLLGAQDTTATPGVRLGLNYAAGTKPGVIVLPVQDDYDDDSLRTIMQRDLDYGDRMNVIALDAETLQGLVPPLGGKINFPARGEVRRSAADKNDAAPPRDFTLPRMMWRGVSCSSRINFCSIAATGIGGSRSTAFPTRSNSGCSASAESRRPASLT